MQFYLARSKCKLGRTTELEQRIFVTCYFDLRVQIVQTAYTVIHFHTTQPRSCWHKEANQTNKQRSKEGSISILSISPIKGVQITRVDLKFCYLNNIQAIVIDLSQNLFIKILVHHLSGCITLSLYGNHVSENKCFFYYFKICSSKDLDFMPILP